MKEKRSIFQKIWRRLQRDSIKHKENSAGIWWFELLTVGMENTYIEALCVWYLQMLFRERQYLFGSSETWIGLLVGDGAGDKPHCTGSLWGFNQLEASSLSSSSSIVMSASQVCLPFRITHNQPPRAFIVVLPCHSPSFSRTLSLTCCKARLCQKSLKLFSPGLNIMHMKVPSGPSSLLLSRAFHESYLSSVGETRMISEGQSHPWPRADRQSTESRDRIGQGAMPCRNLPPGLSLDSLANAEALAHQGSLLS